MRTLLQQEIEMAEIGDSLHPFFTWLPNFLRELWQTVLKDGPVILPAGGWKVVLEAKRTLFKTRQPPR